jgi:RimJ/RimL family protein N-acetyltransferase
MLPLPITTPRLTIDRMTPADAPALAAYRSDPEVARYQSWSAPYPLARAEAFVQADAGDVAGEPGTGVNLAVRLGGALVGDVYVSVPAVAGRPAEVGVTLAPAHQGRGFATEAVGAVVHLLIRAAMVQEVQAFVDARNAPSLALFERLGFRRVEVLRSNPDGDDEIRLETSAAAWPREEAVR